MEFVQELKSDLLEYIKVYNEMVCNPVFTDEEIWFVRNEIRKLEEILSVFENPNQ